MTAFAASTRFIRGETFVVALRVASGDLAGATCRMALKRAPGDENPEVAALAVTWMDHLDSDDLASAPGWSGILSAEASTGLTAGRLVMDARIEHGGSVIQAEPVVVEVAERVTGVA